MTRTLRTARAVLRPVLRRLRDERGVGTGPESGAAIIEFCYLGILFLVPIVYIMMTVFDVQRASYGVTAAAREASRAYSLGASPADAQARGVQAATSALADQGIQGVTPQFVCDGTCLTPGSAVEATVTYKSPLPLVPAALGGGNLAIDVTHTHRTPYGEFREAAG